MTLPLAELHMAHINSPPLGATAQYNRERGASGYSWSLVYGDSILLWQAVLTFVLLT